MAAAKALMIEENKVTAAVAWVAMATVRGGGLATAATAEGLESRCCMHCCSPIASTSHAQRKILGTSEGRAAVARAARAARAAVEPLAVEGELVAAAVWAAAVAAAAADVPARRWAWIARAYLLAVGRV